MKNTDQYKVPLVSVVVPAYNVANYIEKAVESVLSQSFSDLELLIVDDASTDETAAVAETFAARDGRVRVLTNESNCGVALTRNRGIAAGLSNIQFWEDGEPLNGRVRAEDEFDALDAEDDEDFLN